MLYIFNAILIFIGKVPVRVIKDWSLMILIQKLAMTPWRPEVKLRYHFLAERHSAVRLAKRKTISQRQKSFHLERGHPMSQLSKSKNHPQLIALIFFPAKTLRTEGEGLLKAIQKVKKYKIGKMIKHFI